MLLSSTASAQLSGSVGVDSDYRYRGISLSSSKPSVRVNANIDSRSGVYGGLSAVQARVPQAGRYTQWIGYAGYARPAFTGASLDFGATYTHFSGNGQYDFTELYGGVLASRWSLRLNYSPNYFGRDVRTAYLDATSHAQLNDTVHLFGHLGFLARLSGNNLGPSDSNRSRADLRVGAGWSLGDADLQVAWVAAGSGGPIAAPYTQRRGGWLFSAAYSF